MSIEGEAHRLHERYKRGDVSPAEVARAQLDAIPSSGRGVNAFVLVDDAVAMEMARASEDRYRRGEALGPMDGVPVTIKDTLNVAGWPTRRGARTTSDTAAPTDAVSIARLRTSGAVFLGKTTTSEFAWKGLTESPLYGVTTNPLDPDRHAGGSSGGAAAATASGPSRIRTASRSAPIRTSTPACRAKPSRRDRSAFLRRSAASSGTSRPSGPFRSIRIPRLSGNFRISGRSRAAWRTRRSRLRS